MGIWSPIQAKRLAAVMALMVSLSASGGAETASPAPHAAHRVVHLEPGSGALIEQRRPEISGTFAHAVDPHHVHIRVDGRDVTDGAFVSRHAFLYQPILPLAPGRRSVAVATGTGHEATWSFMIIEAPGTNAINGLAPVTGSRVGQAFAITGFTSEGARLRILATWNMATLDFREGAESAVIDTVADARGFFTAHVEITDLQAPLVDVRIQSTARDGKVAVRTLRLRRRTSG
jgi:hypothetical protein